MKKPNSGQGVTPCGVQGQSPCVFCRIIAGEIPCKKVYEDEWAFAFLDNSPICEGHTLVVPKKHYENLHDVPEDILGHVIAAVKRVASKYPVVRIVQNNGAPLQEVFHLHFHVLPGGGTWTKK